jgi:hypothetical protein
MYVWCVVWFLNTYKSVVCTVGLVGLYDDKEKSLNCEKIETPLCAAVDAENHKHELRMMDLILC